MRANYSKIDKSDFEIVHPFDLIFSAASGAY